MIAVNLICDRCQRVLEPAKVSFAYLGQRFSMELPRCAQCGQVYVDEALVFGRIAETEILLEDK